MLDFAKAVHDALGIESPRLFIAVCALIGSLLFGGIGWVVDRGYRIRMREHPIEVTRSQPDTKGTNQTPTAPPTSYKSGTKSDAGPTIEQRSIGANSPNVATGDNSRVEINGK